MKLPGVNTCPLVARLVAALFAIGLSTACASAQSCNFTFQDVNFGDVTDAATDITSSFTGDCTGTSGRTIVICPSIGSGSGGVTTGNPRLLKSTSGSDTVDYQLYSDASRSIIWGSALWGNPQRPPMILATLNGGGYASISRTIFSRYFAGQATVVPATYNSNFTGADGRINYKYYNNELDCSDVSGWKTDSDSFNIKAQRDRYCEVSSTDVNFGSVSSLSSTINGQGSLSIKCTPTTTYRIRLLNGQNYSGGKRRMRLNSQYVQYELYSDVQRTSRWGNNDSQDVSATGTGFNQSFPVYGQVPAQTTPNFGTYTDIVVVNVIY
ncbi:MAG: spore coat U domain-containing protein [Rhizobiaceae bacterium]|nr:spore coat U domain-containing protein [Rhizobiaceae bacterium]